MELILKLAVGGVSAAICANVLRRSAPEFVVPGVLACGAWVLLLVGESLGRTAQTLAGLIGLAGVDMKLVEPVVKVVGISLVTRVSTEVCKSAGEGGIAAFLEVAGTILSLGAALPLINAVVELITELL